jgi:ATP-binding cassette subfamily B protein
VPYFKRYALRLAVGFSALVIVDFLQLWIPRVIKYAVDELEQGVATYAGLLKYGVVIVLLALVIGALRYAWRHFIIGFSRLLEMHLRNRIFSHVLTLDRAFFQRRTVGDVMALSTNDMTAVQMSSGIGLVAFVDAVVMTLAVLGFMAYIHLPLTLIALAPMPLLAILTRLLSAMLYQRFNKVQEEFAGLTEFVRASFSSVRLIKAYNQEQPQVERFDQLGQTYVRDNFKLAFVFGTLWPLSGLVGSVSLLLVFFYGGRLTIAGEITAGDFVAFIAYLFMLTWPMMAIGWVTNLFQRGLTSLNRIRTLLEEKPILEDPGGPAPVFPVQGNIHIRNLSFTYPNQRVPALEDISLDMRSGLLGIVGRTGSGKTTLCHLLTRLYPVEDHSIFLDGEDVNTLALATVRRAIAYVPQDVILFSESIAFNIAMGKPDATQEEIEAVARAAAIHDEIVAMEKGYETRIGEKGVKLSGGQRQRLAIARALLLDRPIIIIDDGLSAVDMETEHAIIRSITDFLRGRTCIIVSHRVAPLAEAQEIVVMDRGRIVAKGPHEDLLEQSPFYATIYQQQTLCSGLRG